MHCMLTRDKNGLLCICYIRYNWFGKLTLSKPVVNIFLSLVTSSVGIHAICPAPVHRTLQPSSSPYTPYACGAQRALRHEYSWSTGYDPGVVHINHVVNWTANQSGLVTLTFDLLALKMVSESCVTWATSVPILIFLGLSVLELRPIYATDRRQTDRRQTKASLNAPAY